MNDKLITFENLNPFKVILTAVIGFNLSHHMVSVHHVMDSDQASMAKSICFTMQPQLLLLSYREYMPFFGISQSITMVLYDNFDAASLDRSFKAAGVNRVSIGVQVCQQLFLQMSQASMLNLFRSKHFLVSIRMLAKRSGILLTVFNHNGWDIFWCCILQGHGGISM